MSEAVRVEEDPWVFEAERSGVGRLRLRALRLPEDAPTIHDWVRRDYARYWGMQGLGVDEVAAAYRMIMEPDHVRVFLGCSEVTPVFLTECYRPAQDHLARYYPATPGDRGMHLLVAPPRRRIHGFTRAAFRTVIELLFADPTATRIVVEPDRRNEKIRALNRAFGFREIEAIDLPPTPTTPGKTAMLSWCTRQDFARALAEQARTP